MVRRLLAHEAHDAQRPGPEPAGHRPTQLADHARPGTGVDDDDDDLFPHGPGAVGVLEVVAPVAPDDLTEPVHGLKHQRPQGNRNLVVGVGGHQLPQCARRAQSVQPSHGQPGRRLLIGADTTFEMAQSQPLHPGGPLATRPQLDPDATERLTSGGDLFLVGCGGQEQAPAQVAGAAVPPRFEMRIVERRPQEGHPAGGNRRRRVGIGAELLVGDHRLLLGPARGVDSRVALGVIGPGLAGGFPSAANPAHSSVDVKDLEHGLQSSAPQRRHRLQRRRRHRPFPRFPLPV